MKFFYEACLEIFISLALNLQQFYVGESFDQQVGRYMTIIFLISMLLFLMKLCHVFRSKDALEAGSDRYGSVYEHINYPEYLYRGVPFWFVLKRVLFTLGCFYLKYELVPCYQIITLSYLVYLTLN